MGSGLPKQGAEWAAEQRLATTWYSKNPEATQQVLGPRELPSDWEGIWRLTQLLTTPCQYDGNDGEGFNDVTDPASLRDIIDALREDGAFLRVLWASAGQHILRFGRIGKASFPHDRMTDIKWQVTFEWTGRGARAASVGTQLNNEQNLFAAQQAAAQVAAKILLDAAASLKNGGDLFTIADLEQFANYPALLGQQLAQAANLVSSKLKQIGDLLVTAALSPAAFSDAVFNAATQAITQFTNLAVTITQIPTDYMPATGSRGSVSSIARALDQMEKILGATDAATEALVDLLQSSLKLSQQSPAQGNSQGNAPQQVLATHLCKEGETFISLALTYYADPDQAGALALANGLPAYQVAPDPGFILIVPVKALLAQWGG